MYLNSRILAEAVCSKQDILVPREVPLPQALGGGGAEDKGPQVERHTFQGVKFKLKAYSAVLVQAGGGYGGRRHCSILT